MSQMERAIPGGGKAATVVISGTAQHIITVPPSDNRIPSYSPSTTVATVTDVHSQLFRDRVKKSSFGMAAGL